MWFSHYFLYVCFKMKLTSFWEGIEIGNNSVAETEVLLFSSDSIDYTNGIFLNFCSFVIENCHLNLSKFITNTLTIEKCLSSFVFSCFSFNTPISSHVSLDALAILQLYQKPASFSASLIAFIQVVMV